MGACGQVDRVLDSISEGLGFDSHCWSCVEVSGKLLIPYCLCPPSSNGYLVESKIGKLWVALAAENALNSPQRRWDCIRESSNTRGVDCKVCWTHGDIRVQTPTFTFNQPGPDKQFCEKTHKINFWNLCVNQGYIWAPCSRVFKSAGL